MAVGANATPIVQLAPAASVIPLQASAASANCAAPWCTSDVASGPIGTASAFAIVNVRGALVWPTTVSGSMTSPCGAIVSVSP